MPLYVSSKDQQAIQEVQRRADFARQSTQMDQVDFLQIRDILQRRGNQRVIQEYFASDFFTDEQNRIATISALHIGIHEALIKNRKENLYSLFRTVAFISMLPENQEILRRYAANLQQRINNRTLNRNITLILRTYVNNALSKLRSSLGG